MRQRKMPDKKVRCAERRLQGAAQTHPDRDGLCRRAMGRV